MPLEGFWIAHVWVFLLGLCVGSFLNVVIYRLPAGLSLVRP
ncbi:MAG: prepilin peptidase, partial [Deltaproteobacteria bacterium]